MIVFV